MLARTVLASAVVLGLAATAASAASIETFDFLGSNETDPTAIDRHGNILGTWIDASDRRHGFVRAPDGQFTSFDVPNSESTATAGADADGNPTGHASISGFWRGFIRHTDGTFTVFQAPDPMAGVFPSRPTRKVGPWVTSHTAMERKPSFATTRKAS